MKNKRISAILLCLAVLICLLGGCSKTEEPQQETNDVLSIYATFYPIYAIADMITEAVPELELHCLVQPQDGCLRDYTLSDWDLVLLARSADLILAGGRELESFESLLYLMGEDGPAVSALLYNMELQNITPENAGAESHWRDDNPHVYMKIDGAIELAQRIAANMMLLDSENAEIYEKNLADAKNRLKSLEEEMHAGAEKLSGRRVILMNEALVYTAEEFGLEIACCVDRDSGESFYGSAMDACLEQLAAADTQLVLIEKQAPQALCEALEGAGYAVARMDILSTRRANEGAEGYFEAQRANAATLKEAIAAGEDIP